jgi:hypothetical protein
MLQVDVRGRTVHWQPVLDYLQVCFKRPALALNAERGLEIGKCLERLLLSTIDTARNSLGTTWTSSQRQGNGQPPFESKAEPIEDRQTSNEALPGIFSLLRTCAERCPVFLLRLPAAPGLDCKEDSLYRLAVESAVASLIEADVETSRSAMEYLESTVKLTQNPSDNVRYVAEEVLSRVRWNIVTMLLVGACGKMNPSILGDAAVLLSSVLLVKSASFEETESQLVQAVRNDQFLLGNNARSVSLGVLMKCTRNEVTSEEIAVFLGNIWELHQIENSEALEGSDVVARFCRKYGS